MVAVTRRVYEGVAVSIEWLTAALTLALVLLVSVNVVARYGLDTGLGWAEELSRLAFMWVAFLGAYVAMRRQAHLAVTAIVDRLPRLARTLMILLGYVLVAVFLVAIANAGIELVTQSLEFDTRTPILGISIAWSYLPIVVSMVLMLAQLSGEFFKAVIALRRGEDPLAPDQDELPKVPAE